MDGFVSVLKPPGVSSSDIVLHVRKKLPRGTKVGHGGTLDPEAAGVLPICIGKAVRLFDYIIDKEKHYIAELTLGVQTDTQDATGSIVEKRDVHVCASEIRAALPEFIGEIMQIPPMYSAIKRDGKRLYQMARDGQVIEVEPRRVNVYGMEYLGASGENRHMFGVSCGKGVYIRTLMHDLGERLGCLGHMSFLLRDRAGIFTLDGAHTPDELSNAEDIASALYPMDAPIQHIARVDLDASRLKAIQNGNPVSGNWYEQRYAPNTDVRIYVDGTFAGIGMATETGEIRFRAMLL